MRHREMPGGVAGIRAVLFDLDGTLADSEPLWLRAKATVARRHGVVWTEHDGIASIGQATEVYSAEFVRRGAQSDHASIGAEITAEVAQGLDDGVPWRPGALDVLAQALDAGLRTGLVTMAFRQVAEAVARASGLPVFDVIVAGDDVTRSKPHPEPYLAALSALGLDATAAVAVEDTLTGALSAGAAGLRTIVIPSLAAVPAAPGRLLYETLDGFDLRHALTTSASESA